MAVDRDDAEELQRLAELHAALGLPSRWLGPRDARALEPGLSPRIRGAIHAPRDHQADPAATVRALAAACRGAGVSLCEQVEVAELVRTGGAVTGVATATAEIPANAVVVAAGAWSAGLAADAPPVRPVKGQIASLRTPDPALAPAHVVRTPRCYLLAREDGRIVLGATVEERGFDVATTADGVFRLLEAAREVLPDVGELEWTGVRAGPAPGHARQPPGDRARRGRGARLGDGPLPQRRAARAAYRRDRLRDTRCERARAVRRDEAMQGCNGEPRELRDSATVADAVDASGAPESGVAVAVEGEVVPRGRWTDRALAEGEQVEVLQAVQGG